VRELEDDLERSRSTIAELVRVGATHERARAKYFAAELDSVIRAGDSDREISPVTPGAAAISAADWSVGRSPSPQRTAAAAATAAASRRLMDRSQSHHQSRSGSAGSASDGRSPARTHRGSPGHSSPGHSSPGHSSHGHLSHSQQHSRLGNDSYNSAAERSSLFHDGPCVCFTRDAPADAQVIEELVGDFVDEHNVLHGSSSELSLVRVARDAHPGAAVFRLSRRGGFRDRDIRLSVIAGRLALRTGGGYMDLAAYLSGVHPDRAAAGQ
jgi:hypothetical protein